MSVQGHVRAEGTLSSACATRRPCTDTGANTTHHDATHSPHRNVGPHDDHLITQLVIVDDHLITQLVILDDQTHGEGEARARTIDLTRNVYPK